MSYYRGALYDITPAQLHALVTGRARVVPPLPFLISSKGVIYYISLISAGRHFTFPTIAFHEMPCHIYRLSNYLTRSLR